MVWGVFTESVICLSLNDERIWVRIFQEVEFVHTAKPHCLGKLMKAEMHDEEKLSTDVEEMASEVVVGQSNGQ